MKVYVLVDCSMYGNDTRVFKTNEARKLAAKKMAENYECFDLTDDEFNSKFIEINDGIWFDLYECELEE